MHVSRSTVQERIKGLDLTTPVKLMQEATDCDEAKGYEVAACKAGDKRKLSECQEVP